MLGVRRRDLDVSRSGAPKAPGVILRRHRGIREAGGIEGVAYKTGCFCDFEQFACNLQRGWPPFRHCYRYSSLLEIARQHARARKLGKQARE
jgi:hypothetical protein